MTTVAWDGTSLAADTLLVDSCGLYEEVPKIFRLRSGGLLGGAGDYAEVMAILEWLNHGGEPPVCKDASAVLIARDGSVKRLVQHEGAICFIPMRKPFYAIGSGRDFALMAMHLGKSAREAVALAALFDRYTNTEVQSLTLAGDKH